MPRGFARIINLVIIYPMTGIHIRKKKKQIERIKPTLVLIENVK